MIAIHGERVLIYPGSVIQRPEPVSTPAEVGLPYEEIKLTTSDKIKLRTYVLVQKRDLKGARTVRTSVSTDVEFARQRPTVFIFHGNAENFGDGVEFAKIFFLKMRSNVVMVSYRGYGGCSGKPTQKGISIDSQTVLDYVLQHDVLGHTSIILYGLSIGGAVAIDLASRNPTAIHGLVVENTFLSLTKMVPTVLPVLAPFKSFVRDKWRSHRAIRVVPETTPILFLSGAKDEVVPPSHMKTLYELSCHGGDTKPTRTFVVFENGTHNDTWDQPTYWRTFRAFVDRVVATRNERASEAQSTVSTPTPSPTISGSRTSIWQL